MESFQPGGYSNNVMSTNGARMSFPAIEDTLAIN